MAAVLDVTSRNLVRCVPVQLSQILLSLLNNALHAPSAGFSQGWAFLLLDTSDDVARFWDSATPAGEGDDEWSVGMRRAPVIIVPLS